MATINTKNNVFVKALNNPAFGLIPLLLFSLLNTTINTYALLVGGLLWSLVGIFKTHKYSRYIYEISAIAFGVTLNFSYFVLPRLDSFRQFVFVEVVFVLAFLIMRRVRRCMIPRILKSEACDGRGYLQESLRVAFQTQYGLFFHLLIVLLYFMLIDTQYFWIDVVVINLIVQIIIVAIILGEMIRLGILNKKLRKEEWLPVVNERGEVEGKIAKSVSCETKNKHMHPMVRIVLMYNGMLYLQPRPADSILDPGKLDYPFEKYMKYSHNVEEAAQNSIKSEEGREDIPMRFLLKYVFENDAIKRMMYLYVVDINDAEMFDGLHLEGGKLWSPSQIDDNMKTGIFSEIFEQEYDYLKNTVLMFQKFKRAFG